MITNSPLTIECKEGKTADTVIFSLTGPLLLRTLFEFQSLLRKVAPPRLTLIDISQVPYMDSAGMGLLMNHYVHCQTKGTKLIVVGTNSRVLDLFKITKVSTVLPMAATIEDAEASA